MELKIKGTITKFPEFVMVNIEAITDTSKIYISEIKCHSFNIYPHGNEHQEEIELYVKNLGSISNIIVDDIEVVGTSYGKHRPKPDN